MFLIAFKSMSLDTTATPLIQYNEKVFTQLKEIKNMDIEP